jgi:hypothetical protein
MGYCDSHVSWTIEIGLCSLRTSEIQSKFWFMIDKVQFMIIDCILVQGKKLA